MSELSPSQCQLLEPDHQEVIRHSAATARSRPAGELQAWEKCVGKGGGAALFLHPQMVLSDLQKYQGSQIFVLPGNDGLDGELRGLAVLTPDVVRVWALPTRFGVVRVKGFRLMANQLVETDEAAVVQLVRALARLLLDGEADCLLFEDIRNDSMLWQALHVVAAEQQQHISLCVRRPPQLRHLIKFPDPPADYWKKFSSKTRNTLRRKAAKFEHRLVKATTAGEVPAFLESAHRISTNSWQGVHLGKGVRNSTEEHKYWTQLASLGAFRSYLMVHAGRPAAFVIGTTWNGIFTYYQPEFDQAYLEHSPGTILLFRMLEDLIAQETPKELDFGETDQP